MLLHITIMQTSIPTNVVIPKFSTDISVLQKTIAPTIKTIPKPEIFYSQPENQSKMSDLIQSSRNIVYSYAPPVQTVLPLKVENKIVSDLEKTKLTVRPIVPVPTGQSGIRPPVPEDKKTSIDVPEFKPDKQKYSLDVSERVQKITEDIYRTTYNVVEDGVGLGKNILTLGLIAGAILLLK